MQTQPPQKQAQRQPDPIRWLIIGALLLALLMLCGISQLIFLWLTPRNTPSVLNLLALNEVSYQPWSSAPQLPPIAPSAARLLADIGATQTSRALTPLPQTAIPLAPGAEVPALPNAPTLTPAGDPGVRPTATPRGAPLIPNQMSTAQSGSTVIAAQPTVRVTNTPSPTRARPSATSLARTPTATPRVTNSSTPVPASPVPASPVRPTPTRIPIVQPTATRISAPVPTALPPPSTRVPATNTPAPPTNTLAPPPNTPLPPTNTPVPPTNTRRPSRPTRTPVPPTPVPPTPVPPTNTLVPPTPEPPTPVPPTEAPTLVPPTSTEAPTTEPTVAPTPDVATPTVVTPTTVPPPSVSKKVTPSQATINENITFTISVVNKTDAPVTITKIVDTLPQDFVITSCASDHGGTCFRPPSGLGQIEWPVAPSGYTVVLQPGESMQLTIAGRFPVAPQTSQVCNTDYEVSWTGGSSVSGKEACVTIQ